MCEQSRHRLAQHLWRKRVPRGDKHGHIPVVRRCDVKRKEPALHRRQRYVAANGPALRFGYRRDGDDRGQRADALMLEHLGRGDGNTGAVCLCDHLNGEDGIAAQFKKVIVYPHLFSAKHLGPDVTQQALQWRRGRSVATPPSCRLGGRLWQSLAVYFAGRGARHGREQHKRRWHHIARHPGLQKEAYLVHFDIAHPIGHNVGDKTGIAMPIRAALLACDNRHITDGRVFGQYGLYLG